MRVLYLKRNGIFNHSVDGVIPIYSLPAEICRSMLSPFHRHHYPIMIISADSLIILVLLVTTAWLVFPALLLLQTIPEDKIYIEKKVFEPV